MSITIEEWEFLFRLVINKLKSDKINSIDFNVDEYWIILTSEWNDFEKIPEPAVGSLFDDIKSIKKSIKENEIITYTDFDRLASLLRAISEINAPLN